VLRLLEGVKIPRSMLARKYGGCDDDNASAKKKPRVSRAKKTVDIGEGGEGGEPAAKPRAKPRASRAKKTVDIGDLGESGEPGTVSSAKPVAKPAPKPRASRAKKTVCGVSNGAVEMDVDVV
jgi:hypothetical protein